MRLFEPTWYRAQAELDRSVDALAHYRSVGIERRISPHPLFHPKFYLDQVPGLADSGQCPFTHYLEEGWRRGLNPHPMISANWLRRQLPDLGSAEPIQYLVSAGLGATPLSPLFVREFYQRVRAEALSARGQSAEEHFLATGWSDGLPTHPLFSAPAYLLQVPAARGYKYGPAAHYVQHGWSEGLPINPAFDAGWYLGQQGELQTDPALHYCAIGWRSGASPHPLFDVSWYEDQMAGLELEVSHLEHYLSVGWSEGKSPHPLFDLDFYLKGGEVTENVHPFLHFLAVGDPSRRAAHPLFRPDLYLAWYPQVAASGAPPHRHYAIRGHREFRRPHPMFDPRHYACVSPDPEGAARGGLLHYLKADPASRRHPHPLFDGAAQRLQSAAAQAGADPLTDYVQFRAAPAQVIAQSHWRGPGSSPRRSREPALASVPRETAPLVSVLMPVYSSPRAHLASAIRSVREQTYDNWELVIVDDGSPELDTYRFCQAEAANDTRIKVFRNQENGGISAATNTALAKAAGEYVAMLDHDDLMRPAALEALVAAALEAQADAAYSDQAYITESGAWDGDFRKPDWSPALMAGVMYVGHLLLVRRELAQRLGGFDSKFDRVQDFEFMLRVSEQTKRIVHVPAVLYDWRRVPGSIAHDASAKGAVEPIQAAAVNAHFARISFPGRGQPHERLAHRLRVAPALTPELASGMLLVLGGCPGDETVRACVAAAQGSRVAGRLEVLKHAGCAGVAELDELAARSSDRVLVYWNPAAQPLSPHFLQPLMMHLAAADAACASLHTCTRDGRVLQAGGVFVDGRVKPAMMGERIGSDGDAGSLACDREVSLVLGPLIAVRLDHWRRLGGLDRDLGSPSSALTDLSIRAHAAGLRNVAIASCVAVLPAETPLLPELDQILISQKHAATFGLRDPFFIPAHEAKLGAKVIA